VRPRTSHVRSRRNRRDDRRALLETALEASDLERRRIAADLHDGVVQDLAGVALALGAAADRTSPAADARLLRTLRESAAATRQCMQRLRTLLVEIYPAHLERAGLEAALQDLLAPLSTQGIEARLEVEPGFCAPPAVEQLFFRASQEALRNVVTHAGARAVRIEVSAAERSASLVVSDDGRGFSANELAQRRREGHVGLGLLTDQAAHLGGRLRVDSAPGRGTRMRLEVPTG
jgi:signal transduction histidine kinase